MEHNGACYMASVNIHVSDQPPAHFFLPTCFRHYCHYFPMRMRELLLTFGLAKLLRAVQRDSLWKIQESLEEPRSELVIADVIVVFTLMRSSTLLN